VRTVLGDRAEQVEEVALISETGYEELAEPIRQRLGMTPGQKNVLVCVSIRDPARSLPSEVANALARQLHRALHQGSRGYL
jgi:phenylalanyl-tRNA synthetase alpha chain